jgi:hypothetical protein
VAGLAIEERAKVTVLTRLYWRHWRMCSIPTSRRRGPDTVARRAAVEQQPLCVDGDTVIIYSSTRQLIPAMAHFPAHRREKSMISIVPFSHRGEG